MRRTRLNGHTAELLLSGAVVAADAPPGLASLAALLRDARPRPATEALPREAATVASMRAVLRGRPTSVPETPRKPVLTKILTAKAAAVVVVACVGAGSAAAATGSLPSAAQSTASNVLGQVGISVPKPAPRSSDHSGGQHPGGPTTTVHGNGPKAPAAFGPCTALAAGGRPVTGPNPPPSPSSCASVPHPGQGTPEGGPNGQPGSTSPTTRDGQDQPGGPTTTGSGTVPGPGAGKPGNGQGNGNANGHGSKSRTTPPTTVTTTTGTSSTKALGAPPGPSLSEVYRAAHGVTWR